MRTVLFVILSLSVILWTNFVYAEYCEVIVLGTGTPRPSINRFGPATLVSAGGEYFLFDSGRGVTIRLQQAGISPDLINKVFLTHLHSDHISGLDDLWITGWIWQRDKPLHVSGPVGTNKFVQHLREAYTADISYRMPNTDLDAGMAEIESKNISEGVIYEENGVTIKTFLVDHPPVKPALGYRLEFGERVIVISGDTTYTHSVVEQARDADVLIHEIAAANEKLLQKNKRLQKVMNYHTNPDQLIKVLKGSKPRFAVLTHLLLFGVEENDVLTQIRSEYKGDVMMGYDLMKIGVGNNITVQNLIPEIYE